MFLKALLLLPCLIFIALGIPLIRQMVPPNHGLGYRTSRTLGNEEVWYAVNTNVGWALVIFGIISAIIVIFVFRMNLHMTTQSLISVVVFSLGAVAVALVGYYS